MIGASIFIAGCDQRRPVRIDKGGIKVVGIADGDTLTVLYQDEKRKEKVRLATIDSPEMNQAFGKKSKASLSEMAFGKEVEIRKISVDKYGRIVAEVYAGDVNLNVEQLRRGFAWYYRKYKNEINARSQLEYEDSENYAREKRLGLWQLEKPIPPWEFRKQRRKK